MQKFLLGVSVCKILWKNVEKPKHYEEKIVIYPIITHFPFDTKVRRRVKISTWPQLVSPPLTNTPADPSRQECATATLHLRLPKHGKAKFFSFAGHAHPTRGTRSIPVDIDRRAYHYSTWKILPGRQSFPKSRGMNDRMRVLRGRGHSGCTLPKNVTTS
jgi:hypothetical protein